MDSVAHPTPYDTVIVGGGPAGLTAALALTRYRQRTLVVESPAPPRNDASLGTHGVIGLEGASPAEVRARAWQELDGYGLADRRDATVEDVVALPDGGFEVRLDDGSAASGRAVLLATGVRDVHPEHVAGFAECYGRTVIHCPFCVGWENTGRTWGLVTRRPAYAALAATAFRAWSDDVIAIAPPGMERAEETRAALRRQGSDLVLADITRLHHEKGELHAVECADGTRIPRQTLLWDLPQEQVPLVTRLHRTLGLALDDAGYVAVDKGRATSVRGLYAAGDLTSRWEQGAAVAAAAGAVAADTIHFAATTAMATATATTATTGTTTTAAPVATPAAATETAPATVIARQGIPG
ncbi:NAD(P)/FAD-dependent oxidoreductase [Streptomyces sp. URMC 123]|uniref:NAD(P)/FAD-dependent oxidoreductase n=1 Tax=Streptomyces sp. URMC 123 TaxID=3423403 RepID=UPI003F196694